MHPDEIAIELPLVARLIAAQFPRWRHLPLVEVRSAGTDNAIYRLGDGAATDRRHRGTAVAVPRRPARHAR